jgi:hypothetical protein
VPSAITTTVPNHERDVTAAAMPAMSFESAYCRAPPTTSATKPMAIKAINPNITLRSGMMWLRYTSYVFAGLIYLNTFFTY